MKYAIVNDTKCEAKKGLSGFCPSCEGLMIAKCGAKVIHHWAHKGNLECDHWWEPETEWHRNWKDHFPKECQEVVHQDPTTGERHIADVKTSSRIVLEFQHSPIKPEERKSRNEFYKNIVWIVDGKRLERDEENFAKAYNEGTNIAQVRRIVIKKSSLVEKWTELNVPVFFDFKKSVLWLLVPIISNENTAYLLPVKKEDFLEIYKNVNGGKINSFYKWMHDFIVYIKNPHQQRQRQVVQLAYPTKRYVRRGPRIDYLQNRRRRYQRRL